MGSVVNLFSRRRLDDNGTEQPQSAPDTPPQESTLDVDALTQSYNRNQERQREERKKNNASVTRSYKLARKKSR
jgi:hypothetical protein